MSSSIDGLVSGLQTTSMINSLMQIEAQPQNNLKNKVSAAKTAVASYQAVNNRLAALKTAADDLSQLSTWRAIKATSNTASVTATAVGGTNTTTGATTFDVVSLARSQVSTARVATSGPVTGSDTITVDVGGVSTSIDISGTDKSAQAISDAINAKGIAVKAAVVNTGGDTNILQLSGTKTGAVNAFTVSGLEDLGTPLTTAVAATDAKLQVGGTEEEGGYAVTSASNTFTGLMTGVTMTVSKLETNVTVQAAADVSGIAAKFQAVVDAANATLGEVSSQTAYDAANKKGSPLTGDFMVRQISQTILSKISSGLTYDNPDYDKNVAEGPDNPKTISYGSLSKIGIQLDSTGRLTFDQTKFAAAYNEDPNAIKKAGIGFADVFESFGTQQSRTVSAVITGRNSEIDSMTDQITDWDTRLAAKRQAMQRQYASLETALGKLKDQSSWLSSQIASLG